MTISIALKVGDGVVLGTDSASMLVSRDGRPENLYRRSEKLLNLVPGLPIGMLAYGLGDLEHRSVTRLARDLRQDLSSPESGRYLNPARYSLEQASQRVWEFFHRKYSSAYPVASDLPLMGLILAGYSAGTGSSEVWSLRISESARGPVRIIESGEPEGLYWQGEGEALSRLLHGAAPVLHQRLHELGFSSHEVRSTLDASSSLWHPAMPIQDAIELVRYLAEVVIGFERFSPGIPLVDRPIDLAAITLHEGFRWIQRTHWFDPAINPTYAGRVHSLAETGR